jgi:hypothetical protein
MSADAEFEKRVSAAVAAQNLQAAAQNVAKAGEKAFPDWAESIHALDAAGVKPEHIDDIIQASHAPEKLIHDLGKHPERATRIANMDPRSRVAELVRMDAAISRPPPAARPAPKAPAPGALSDEQSDDEWSRSWDATFKRGR